MGFVLERKDGWPVVGNPESVRPEKVATQSPFVGRWNHLVNKRDRYDIFFEPTGEITGTKGKSEWEIKGAMLLKTCPKRTGHGSLPGS